VEIDTTAPAAPSTPDLATASDSGASSSDNVTSDSTPSFGGSAEPNSTVDLYAGATLVGSGSADGSGNWSITSSLLADGSYSLTAKATDLAGNTGPASGSLSVTIDTAAPAAPSTPDLTTASDSGASSSDDITSDSTPSFAGTAENGSSVQLFVDGVGDSTGSASPYSITASPLLDGTYAVTARATDTAGNTSAASGSLSVTIDTTAPAAPSTPDLKASSDSGSFDSDDITSDSTPSFAGTAENGSSVQLFDGASGNNSGSASPYSITTTTLADGNHSISAKATDLAGNTSAASGSLTVTIDTAAPAVSAPDLAAGSDTGSSSTDNITGDSTPSFGGSAHPNSPVDLYAGSTLVGSSSADGSGNWSITSSPLADGSYSLTAKATDTAGNTSIASGSLSVTIDTTAPA